MKSIMRSCLVGALTAATFLLGPGATAANAAYPLAPFPNRARHSGQCMEVENASYNPGARVLQWPCHGGTHQQWF